VNVAPITRCKGRVHAVAPIRTVAAIEAAPAERDPETGRITKDAVEARAAYEVLDVTVHTDDGGYALVIMKDDALAGLGGTLPAAGDEVDWPVRNYVAWAGRAGRRFPTVGYSVATDVFVAERAKQPARPSAVASHAS
jgi:hypothetical protein